MRTGAAPPSTQATTVRRPVPERLATVAKRTRQLEPNGCAHVADAIRRTEQKIGDATGHAREAAVLAAEAAKIAGQAAVTVAQVHQQQLGHQPAADQRDADIARLAGDVEGIRADIDAGRQREQAYLSSLHELGIPLAEPIPQQNRPDHEPDL